MSPKSRANKPKGKIIVNIVVLCIAAILLISFFSYHFEKSRAIGLVDTYFNYWFLYWLGYCAYIIPILLIVFSLGQLGWGQLKRYAGIIILWLFGIFLFSSNLSFAVGLTTELKNYGGLFGRWFSKISFTYLGFLLTFFIPGFLFYGLIPFIRERDEERPHLRYSLYTFLLIILLQMTISFILPNSHWRAFDGKDLLVAGTIIKGIMKGIHYLIGRWGTLVVLVCIWTILILLFAHLFLVFKTIGDFFKRLFINIYKGLVKFFGWVYQGIAGLFPGKRIVRRGREYIPAAPPTKQEPIEVKVQEELEFETEAKKEKGEAKLKVKFLTPVRFDEQDFQNEFLSCLDVPPQEKTEVDEKALEQEASVLLDKLKEFGIEGKVTEILTGPMITRFELEPAPGVKISSIESLTDDLALSLKAERIRILAPIPGKAVVGIEVPNKYRRVVYLRDIITTDEYTSKTSPLTFALGETITGESYAADLREMPHVLIAGTTGSGKSVCINTMISSIIFRSSYDDVRFLTIDPKQLELPVYNSIPHLLNPTTIDPRHAIKELDRIIAIMEARYGIFAGLGVRDIAGYNQIAPKEGLEKKPYIVVIIDELADLMIRAPTEIEEKITRLAQMSRAVGIHLVLATQRPSVDVITGLIKANFPCRIAFQVASKTDSRTILDMNGAEALLGRGDMLFLPPGKGEPIRLHCAFVSAQATRRIVDLWTRRYLTERLTGLVPNPAEIAQAIVAKQVADVLIDREKASLKRKQEIFYSVISEDIAEQLWQQEYHKPLSEEIDMPKISKTETAGAEREIDELFDQAARIVFRHREASVSMLQRRLDIGWARAGRIIDQLEQLGIVGPYVGSKSRKVVVQSEEELETILAVLKKGPPTQPPPK